MIRMIFSTVCGPQDPAFTVESLAITATGRPCTEPTPVTTASAGSSPARALTRRPSSAKPSASSRSSRSRSRTNSFPCSASFRWYLGAPPRVARSVASAISFPPGRSSSVTRKSVARADRRATHGKEHRWIGAGVRPQARSLLPPSASENHEEPDSQDDQENDQPNDHPGADSYHLTSPRLTRSIIDAMHADYKHLGGTLSATELAGGHL